MMESFIAAQRLVYPLSDATVALLLDGMEEVCFLKGSFSVCEGDRDPYVWFVKEGLARLFVERDGREITLWFASEGERINLSGGERSVYNVEMTEDSVLLRIPVRKLESLFEQSLELANWGRRLFEFYLTDYEDYFANKSWVEAREQYEQLVRERPELLQRVPLKHIASFLQITPQSLSRIRSFIK